MLATFEILRWVFEEASERMLSAVAVVDMVVVKKDAPLCIDNAELYVIIIGAQIWSGVQIYRIV